MTSSLNNVSPAENADAIDDAIELATEPLLFDGLIRDRNMQTSAYRRRRSAFNEQSIHTADTDEMVAKGWEVSRAGKRATRIKKAKPHHQLLEDRAWAILYQMGYEALSESAFVIKFRRSTGAVGSKQIDAFACDNETAIIV